MPFPAQLFRWRNARHASMCFSILLGILISTTQLVTWMFARAQSEHAFPQLERFEVEQTRHGIVKSFLRSPTIVIRPHFSYQ